jgi:hypothetical protein
MNALAKLRYGSVLLGFGLCLATPMAANASIFSGTWSVSGTLGNPVAGTVAPVCKFVTSGSRIAGTCRGPNGVGNASGEFNGRAITFAWRHVATTSLGYTAIATFKGILGGDGVIRGTWRSSATPALLGRFTAIRP